MKPSTKVMISTAVAGLFTVVGAAGTFAAAKKTTKGYHCEGGNACKGKSECKNAAGSCKGTNECAGKGWITTKNKADCETAKKANAAPAKTAPAPAPEKK